MSSPFVLAVDARAVDLALEDYLAHPEEGGGELLPFAHLHHVLPLWTDWVGCIALRPTGQLVFFARDDPEKVEPVMAAADHERRLFHTAPAHGDKPIPG